MFNVVHWISKSTYLFIELYKDVFYIPYVHIYLEETT